MKLRFSPTSPYVRKVSVCAIELGLSDRLEQVMTDPWDSSNDLSDDNPLGRVPALIDDNGQHLYDSAVICEFLDSLSDAAALFPADDSRWRVLRQHALADGLIDAGVNALIERFKRPQETSSEEWAQFQLDAVRRALVTLENDVADFSGAPINIAQITCGVALGYLDFRYKDEIDWRANCLQLASWYEEFSQRDSMLQTVPKMP
ncbi:MAG: glutathione S-transferase N-terminal domain-containing protein [Pseudomonadota bacterium]